MPGSKTFIQSTIKLTEDARFATGNASDVLEFDILCGL